MQLTKLNACYSFQTAHIPLTIPTLLGTGGTLRHFPFPTATLKVASSSVPTSSAVCGRCHFATWCAVRYVPQCKCDAEHLNGTSLTYSSSPCKTPWVPSWHDRNYFPRWQPNRHIITGNKANNAVRFMDDTGISLLDSRPLSGRKWRLVTTHGH